MDDGCDRAHLHLFSTLLILLLRWFVRRILCPAFPSLFGRVPGLCQWPRVFYVTAWWGTYCGTSITVGSPMLRTESKNSTCWFPCQVDCGSWLSVVCRVSTLFCTEVLAVSCPAWGSWRLPIAVQPAIWNDSELLVYILSSRHLLVSVASH